jgi:hypothetical protein
MDLFETSQDRENEEIQFEFQRIDKLIFFFMDLKKNEY